LAKKINQGRGEGQKFLPPPNPPVIFALISAPASKIGIGKFLEKISCFLKEGELWTCFASLFATLTGGDLRLINKNNNIKILIFLYANN